MKTSSRWSIMLFGLFTVMLTAVGMTGGMSGCGGGGGGSDKIALYVDADGDGYGSSASDAATIKVSTKDAVTDASGAISATQDDVVYVSVNTDCDDGNADINPAMADTGGDGIDQNCDGADEDAAGTSISTDPDGEPDTDDDGDGVSEDDGDCDDTDSTINASATEVCGDEVDNDCDEKIDADDDSASAVTYYADADSDGYGDPNTTQSACSQPTGYVDNSNDCNDADASISVYTYYVDADGDGYGDEEAGTTSSCETSAPSGYSARTEDCDDSNANVNPGVNEGYFYANGGTDTNTADKISHGDSIDNDCDGDIDETTCTCDDLTGYDSPSSSSFLFTVPFVGEAMAADDTSSSSKTKKGGMSLGTGSSLGTKVSTGSCDSYLNTFKSLSGWDCEKETAEDEDSKDGGSGGGGSGTEEKTTAYVEKIKVTIKTLDISEGSIGEDAFEDITFGINFKDGHKFHKCPMAELNVDRPAQFGADGATDDFTVDLTTKKECYSDTSIDYETSLQLDNIKEIYLEAEKTGTGWGIETIKMEAEFSDDPAHKLVFYKNDGVWAFVGNAQEGDKHYPNMDKDCFDDGSWGGFKHYYDIDEHSATGKYDIPSFAQATLSFTPTDYWVKVTFKTQSGMGAGGSAAKVDDYLQITFDCGTYLDLYEIDYADTEKTLRFYTSNVGSDAEDFDKFTIKRKVSSGDIDLTKMNVYAHEAWNSTDADSGRTVKYYKKEVSSDFTLDGSEKKTYGMTQTTESFP